MPIAWDEDIRLKYSYAYDYTFIGIRLDITVSSCGIRFNTRTRFWIAVKGAIDTGQFSAQWTTFALRYDAWRKIYAGRRGIRSRHASPILR